jgi:hypothetical protein
VSARFHPMVGWGVTEQARLGFSWLLAMCNMIMVSNEQFRRRSNWVFSSVMKFFHRSDVESNIPRHCCCQVDVGCQCSERSGIMIPLYRDGIILLGSVTTVHQLDQNRSYYLLCKRPEQNTQYHLEQILYILGLDHYQILFSSCDFLIS